MPVLRIKLPNQGEVTHALSGERVSIGRRPDNTIQILDRSVSAHHAELIAVNGHYRLHDLESTNLSFVDGQPVTDYHLHGRCKVAFGTVECEFDSAADESTEPKLTHAQLEQDAAFLRAENSELIAKLDTLQRRVDILSSARLVTGRTDQAPGPAAADSFKALVRERDDLRHQNTGLMLELDQVREELTQTIRERDEARKRAEMLEGDKGGLHRGAPSESEPVDDASSTQRLIAAPRRPESLSSLLRKLRDAIDRLSADAADTQARDDAGHFATQFVEQVLSLGDHAVVRLAHGVDDLLRDFQTQSAPARPAMLRTLVQATELLGTLIEPPHMERGRALPPAHILALDDDSELLATVVATLQLAQIQTDSCGTAEDALVAVAARKFDLVLADVTLPGMNGMAFCAKARELPGYRKTPIVFLTIADTLEQRAESSLNGGTDFIGKPFSVFDLALKVQTWVLKQQLGLL
jgi:CheY-like chemotaxis protein